MLMQSAAVLLTSFINPSGPQAAIVILSAWFAFLTADLMIFSISGLPVTIFNDEVEAQGALVREAGCFSTSNWEDGFVEVVVTWVKEIGKFFSRS